MKSKVATEKTSSLQKLELWAWNIPANEYLLPEGNFVTGVIQNPCDLNGQ